ncbi:uncharacterized protein FA14DRAFT_44475 [Meira miltonrushii]|uniref:Uncharacterized protein n=1 Tax=Meira miltonrushii TaxID=1280837 RepID=A0A316VDF9_9BASI|nr:uncharacterized protein FA14DRAFT_44475 [Meira miltonrushii]PWN35602.1 hypothetical protein FA14DRAFT_44475 [Meira miltonrushii]
MLKLLSYILGLITAIALILCIACGLFYVCSWIEDRPAKSRKIGQRIAQICGLCTLAIAITDRMPNLFVLTSLASFCILHLSLDEQWHKRLPTSVRLIVQTVAPVLPHIILLHSFHPARNTNGNIIQDIPDPAYHSKPKLPGGRLDWDAYNTAQPIIRTYGAGEQLSCFALCWLPTIWSYLIAIADSAALPFANDNPTKSKRNN